MHRTLATLLAMLAIACDPQPAAAPAPDGATSSAPTRTADGVADPVAKIGDETVSLADLDAAAAAGLVKARQQMFDVRKQALDGMIRDKILDAEATARSVSREDLLVAEVDGKVTPVSDEEINAFYQQNQSRMRGDIDQMRDQIRGYLDNERKTARLMAFVTELKAKTPVEVYLEPPRIHVEAGDSPRHGDPSAPVEIIEFSDFQCPYCIRGAETLTSVKQKYGDDVTIVYRHFPLSFHDRAQRAAEASECANDQGKFWEYHDALFANQREMEDTHLSQYATDVGLDLAAFDECLSSGKHVATVETDMKEGSAAGMTGTPGFFINGRFIGGAQPLEVFVEIIDSELASRDG